MILNLQKNEFIKNSYVLNKALFNDSPYVVGIKRFLISQLENLIVTFPLQINEHKVLNLSDNSDEKYCGKLKLITITHITNYRR